MENKMEKQENNDNSILPGIPVDFESDEPWRKSKLTCSGSGRIDKNFDLKNLSFLLRENNGNQD
jgi:hypothetical protein